MRVTILSCFMLLIGHLPVMADVQTAQIGPDLSHPWGMDFISHDEVLVTTRAGALYRISLVTGDSRTIGNLPEVAHFGQGGLLDVLSDGDDIFLCYAKPTQGGAATAIDKATLSGDRLMGRMTIFTSNSKHNTARHFGCRMAMHDGALYASLGDRGNRFDAQKGALHDGSIVRLMPDGRPHPDNPSFKASDKAGYRDWTDESFTIGHRNPQGMAVHPDTGTTWTHEHGPQGGDEINILKGGQNYGWPLAGFGKEYGTSDAVSDVTSHPDMADPVWVWVPSIAPSGMAFYPKDAVMFPALQGGLIVGSLKFKRLYHITFDDEGLPAQEDILFDAKLGRIRDVAVAPDGAILVLNDANNLANPSGGLYRLSQ